ncbi:MAG: M24 family metallopeptidase [Bdellovibrio sp.]|nr:M24 family metallopeptidase [Bdellovibrio sp.]
MGKFELSLERIQKNIDHLLMWMKQAAQSSGIDAFYISSCDIHLNEYTAGHECHRYYVTGFTGSTAEVLSVKDGPLFLFVDGRYHEQAEIEAKFRGVEVVKVPFGKTMLTALLEKIEEFSVKTIGVEADRISYNFAQELGKKLKVVPYVDWDFLPLMKEGIQCERVITHVRPVDLSWVGRSAEDKLKSLVSTGEGFFISALDSLAWLSNCRGVETAFQSSFIGKGLAVDKKLVIFVLKGTKIEQSALQDKALEFIYLDDWASLKQALFPWKKVITKLYFSSQSTNLFDYQILAELWPTGLSSDFTRLTLSQAQKNSVEIKTFFAEYEKSDQAVFNSIQWLKREVRESGQTPSELDFCLKANSYYKEAGAREQSFKTIAAYGAHSSIIHFNNSMADCFLKNGELVLLDSGGYYHSGYATDSTRTFCPSITPNPLAKKIYTLVLKGLLNSMNAVFPPGTLGAQIDALARAGMRLEGYDYGHGTGHGIGINVHEGHYSISPRSTLPLNEGLVGSIEPGIYLSGFGGVRLENGVVVETHGTFPGMLRFRSLTYIGFEENLIDFELLTSQEKKWLYQYETACAERNRSSFNAKTLESLSSFSLPK